MNEYEVEICLSGSVCLTIEAEDEDDAAEKARRRWHASDADLEVEQVTVECARSGFTGTPDVDEEIYAIAKTTIRQFVRLMDYGVTAARLAYEHPEIQMKDIAEAIEQKLRGDYGHGLVPEHVKVWLEDGYDSHGWRLHGQRKDPS